MIQCPNCHHNEYVGSMFCSECGAQLITTGNLAMTPEDAHQDRFSSVDFHHSFVDPDPVGDDVQLYVVEPGQFIRISGQDEFSLGRKVEGQSLMPDIDLSPFNAYGHGVSRMHATIRIDAKDILITDLGSSNGTQVNGNKIIPHVEYPLKHGDIISLGRMKLQVLYKRYSTHSY